MHSLAMGVIIRQGFKSTVVSYAGVALGAFNLLYLFPKYLQPVEIGLREVLLGAAMAFSFFAQLGMTNILARFFPYFEDKDRQHNGFLLLMLLVSGFGFVLFSLAFTLFTPQIAGIFIQNSSLVTDYIDLLIPLTGLMMLQSLLEAYARANLRIAVPTFVREVGLRLILMLLVLAFGYGWISFDRFIHLMIGSYALTVLALLVYLKQLNALHLHWRYLRVGKPLAWEMSMYTAWLLIGGAGSIISDKLDGIMLASLASLSATGIYSVAFFIGTIIELPRRSLSNIASPLIAKAWKENDLQQLSSLYQKSALHQLLIGGWLLIGVGMNLDSLFSLMPNAEIYRQGSLVVLLIGGARLVDMATGLHGDIILSSRYYRFNLIAIVFLAAISFATNYFMIPRYGINGAATGTLISLGLFIILKMAFLRIKTGLQPFTRAWFKTALLLLLCGIIGWLLPQSQSSLFMLVLSIAYKSVLISLLLGYLILRLHISEEIQQLYRTQIRGRLPEKWRKLLPQL